MQGVSLNDVMGWYRSKYFMLQQTSSSFSYCIKKVCFLAHKTFFFLNFSCAENEDENQFSQFSVRYNMLSKINLILLLCAFQYHIA